MLQLILLFTSMILVILYAVLYVLGMYVCMMYATKCAVSQLQVCNICSLLLILQYKISMYPFDLYKKYRPTIVNRNSEANR